MKFQPRWESYAINRLKAASQRRTNVDFYNALPHPPISATPSISYLFGSLWTLNVWIVYAFTTILVWFGAIGLTLTLLLSKAFVNPLSWSGFVYDVIYARANDQPNGAHILSYLVVPIVGFVVAYRFIPDYPTKALKVTGGIYQGIAVGAVLVAVHEGLWGIFYYTVYAQYLSWAILTNVLRDASFGAMLVCFVVAYWKYKDRTISMKIFLLPTFLYVCFLLAWTFIPTLFGFNLLPITTINNPAYANNLYQETIWWSNPWVNLTEVVSWVMLATGFIIQILRLKK